MRSPRLFELVGHHRHNALPASVPSCPQRFACVENAKFGTPASVQPGGSWQATANFSVVNC